MENLENLTDEIIVILYTPTVGEAIKVMRNKEKLSQRKFAEKIGKTRDWISTKEINTVKIYIHDFIKMMKTFNFEIIFMSEKLNSNLSLREYPANEFLRKMWIATGDNQETFSKKINKTSDWLYSAMSGRNNFYANHLFMLANKYNYVIILKKIK